MADANRFPTSGIIAVRDGLVLAWPEPSEFDRITDLRNQDSVSRWFLNGRKLDHQRNRAWLAASPDRAEEGLLAIRLAATGGLVGTVGWTGYNAIARTACFGRLIVDAREVASARADGLWSGRGIALQAAAILRDYSFEAIGLDSLTTWCFKDNRLAVRVNAALGMTIEREGMRESACGRLLPTLELRLDRAAWLAMDRPA